MADVQKWKMKGQWFDVCRCAIPCPCSWAQPPDDGFCEGILIWHIQEGRSVIPKSTKAHRIAENFDVFDFELSNDELKSIDALDTGKRGGTEPEDVNLTTMGVPIPEA